MKQVMKSLVGSVIAIPDLLGALVDKDTSSRVRGVMMMFLCILMGWFAKDYFMNQVTTEDLTNLVVTQRVQQRILEGQMREDCRRDTTQDRTARECERLIQKRVRNIKVRVMKEINGNKD